jgi:hypothetical protein
MMSATFSVHSELPRHAGLARIPYGKVHQAKSGFLGADSMCELARRAYDRIRIETPGDTDVAWVRDDALGVADLHRHIADAIVSTGIYGSAGTAFEECLQAVGHETCLQVAQGAAFHSDRCGHWPSCLFWVLALDVVDVEFVVPHLGVRLPLEPGDLVVFDPSLAHGLCRPRDGGRFLSVHFEDGEDGRHQAFLSGELELDAAHWASLGCAWEPSTSPRFSSAVDLLNADFDSESGRVL